MILALRNNAVAFWNWRGTIWQGVIQALNDRTRGSKLAMVLALAEPLILIALLYFIRGYLKGGVPKYGPSLLLFLCSGLLPFYLFIRISSRARTANVGPRRRLPGLSALDVYISSVSANSLIWIVMMVAMFVGMWLYGIQQARPESIVDCTIPIVLLILFGVGLGMINNVIVRYFALWGRFYAVFTRGMIFASGAIVIVDLLPPWWRQLCILNPLSHAILWFRVGVYGDIFPHNSLDKAYLLECTLVILFLGIVIDRAHLRKLDI